MPGRKRLSRLIAAHRSRCLVTGCAEKAAHPRYSPQFCVVHAQLCSECQDEPVNGYPAGDAICYACSTILGSSTTPTCYEHGCDRHATFPPDQPRTCALHTIGRCEHKNCRNVAKYPREHARFCRSHAIICPCCHDNILNTLPRTETLCRYCSFLNGNI